MTADKLNAGTTPPPRDIARVGDMDGNQMLSRVVRFSKIFGGAKTLEDVCRSIVQSDEFSGKLYGTQIHSLTNRGTLVSAASFGMEGVSANEKLTLFDEHPVAEAARERTVTVVPHPENDDFVLWTMPILKDYLTAGTLNSVSHKDADIEKFNDEEMTAIGNMAYLFLSASGVPEIVKDREVAATGQLTDRQYEILLYMSKGKTNQEIADILILSESSIKQESVKIFRALGVANRQDAVKRAKASGMIPEQEV